MRQLQRHSYVKLYTIFVKYIVILLILLASAYLFVFRQTIAPNVSDSPNITPTTSESQATPSQASVKTVDQYAYEIIPLADRTVHLYSNLDQKLTSSALFAKYDCIAATSGGFYDEGDQHIGLFVSEHQLVRSSISHDLFIGYISSRDGKSIQISREQPSDDVLWALQSGPIVWDDGVTNINMKSDENARRIIAAVDQVGRGYLISITAQDSEYSGPPMMQIPQILEKIQSKEKIYFSMALNLDGGFHSFFKNNSVNQSSLATPGSIFCVK